MTADAKLCPREPTPEMVQRGLYPDNQSTAGIWRAMWDAAPATAADADAKLIEPTQKQVTAMVKLWRDTWPANVEINPRSLMRELYRVAMTAAPAPEASAAPPATDTDAKQDMEVLAEALMGLAANPGIAVGHLRQGLREAAAAIRELSAENERLRRASELAKLGALSPVSAREAFDAGAKSAEARAAALEQLLREWQDIWDTGNADEQDAMSAKVNAALAELRAKIKNPAEGGEHSAGKSTPPNSIR